MKTSLTRNQFKLLKVFFLSLVLSWTANAHSTELTMTMVNIGVGNGDCVFIQTPSGKNILVDAGKPGCGNDVVAFLKSRNVSKIDVMLLTHPHTDHYGGMITVIKEFSIGQYIDSQGEMRDPTYVKLVKDIEAKHIPTKKPSVGDVYDWGGGVTATVISTYDPQDVGPGTNDNSIVVKMKYKNNTFLLTGDIEGSAENFLSKNRDIKADVLKIPHHGLATSSNFSLLRKVDPKIAVAAPGSVEPIVLERYRILGTEVYRTDMGESITISSDGDHLSVKEEKHHDESGYSNRKLVVGIKFDGAEGEYVKKSRKGNVERRAAYKNGKFDGEDSHYWEGGEKIRAKLQWKEGKLEGCEYYYRDGKVMAKIGYKDGVRDGLSQYFGPDGKVIAECTAVNDQVQSSKIYYEDGKLWKEITFKDGKVSQAQVYGTDGKPLNVASSN